MGNIAHDLIKDGKHVLFAFEEAIGMFIYLNDTHFRESKKKCTSRVLIFAYDSTQNISEVLIFVIKKYVIKYLNIANVKELV